MEMINLPFQLLLCTDISLLTMKSGNESAKNSIYYICQNCKMHRNVLHKCMHIAMSTTTSSITETTWGEKQRIHPIIY